MRGLVALAIAVALVAPAGPAAADDASDDVVLRAMKDEVSRTMELELDDVEKPYYVAYRILDVETVSIYASLGALKHNNHDRRRALRVTVRVGDRNFDNSNYGDPRSLLNRLPRQPLPIEDDYDAMRWALWLASDRAYKTAAETLEKKRAALSDRAPPKDAVADFSSETPKSVVQPLARESVDRDALESLVRSVSDVFSQRPAIQASSVSVTLRATTERFTSSEGTTSRQQHTVARFQITAATQAADGMSLEHFVSFAVSDAAALPEEAALVAAATRLADELEALKDAPALGEAYTGPVLFEGPAAAQLVEATLASHLGGTPPPTSDHPRYSQMMGLRDTELGDSIGRRIAERGLRIVDDPGLTTAKGHPVVGGFAFDAEGVPAQRVSLVEDGVLKTLLMSRTPRDGLDRSNGHGRAGRYSPVRAQVSNLVVSSKRGQSQKQLERQLLARAKREGYDYALVVALLDDPAVTHLERDSNLSMFRAMSMGGDPPPPAPIVTYKLTAAGKRELVRGAVLEPIRLRAWRNVVAGRTYAVYSYASSSLGSMFARLVGGGAGEWASVVAPPLLLPDVAVKPWDGPKNRPPVVPNPLTSVDHRE